MKIHFYPQGNLTGSYNSVIKGNHNKNYESVIYVLFGNVNYKTNVFLDGLNGSNGLIVTIDPNLNSNGFCNNIDSRSDLNGDGE